jgi:hypothetical protein
MKTTKTTRNAKPQTFRTMLDAYAARVAATEKAVKEALGMLGFRRDKKYAARECYDRGSLRVAFYSDDERCELYAFTGVAGHSSVAYELNLPFATPAEVLVATITAATQADEAY